VRVVLKQYMGSKMKASRAEVKIFTRLESLRQKRAGSELANLLNRRVALEGLPLMLGYKFTKDCCEIMMTHGGSNLSQWISHIDCR